jgi:ribonuclease BN (tRNA processing enzyme)
MELIVLGSGTGYPLAYRSPPGFVARSQGGGAVLVDCGAGTVHRLPRVGIRFESIREVLITHLHPDHALDLVSLLFAKRTPGLHNEPVLTVRGGRGLDEWLESIRGIFHPWLEPNGYELKVETYERPVETEGFLIKAASVHHHPSSLAYRLEDLKGGVSVVISGDTEECDSLVDLARGATVLVTECSFPETMAVPGHLTPRKAARMAQRAGVGRLVLTHFYPQCEGVEILGICREEFRGEVLLAHDYMSIQL